MTFFSPAQPPPIPLGVLPSASIFFSTIESDMHIHIYHNQYIRMPMRYCSILEFIPNFAICSQYVSAYIRCEVRHLCPINIIISADHIMKPASLTHHTKQHSIIIVKYKSTIPVYGFLHFRFISVLNDRLKHLRHILCDWHYSCYDIRLCSFYDVSHIHCSL